MAEKEHRRPPRPEPLDFRPNLDQQHNAAGHIGFEPERRPRWVLIMLLFVVAMVVLYVIAHVFRLA